jgi:hypothetical protein
MRMLMSILVVFLMWGTLGNVLVKDNVYNVTEENFEEFIEMAKGKNATFYIKFYSRKWTG